MIDLPLRELEALRLRVPVAPSRRTSSALALTVVITCTSAFAQEPSSGPLIGQGRGVDHVGVVVRDLAQAQHDYEQLGFKVNQGGHFPGGLFNCIIHFDNEAYLELLSAKEAQERPSDVADIADFAKRHEGAMFLGLNVSSAK